MRKIVTAAFVSIDGVMQAPGGPNEDPTGGFAYGGWLAPLMDDTVVETLDDLFYGAPFDLLLGRKTYDIFSSFWPHVERNPKSPSFDAGNAKMSERFDEVTKFVATHRTDPLAWKNSRSLGPDAVATLRELKRGDGPRLLTQGSSVLVQDLLQNDLIDELHVMTFPLTLGRGKRLFADGTRPAAFELVKHVTSPRGALLATYQRAGEVTTGSFADDDKPSAAELERRKHLA
jgi:dihydrofolate reductase